MHLTLSDLNRDYGHMGRTFETKEEAEQFKKGLKNGGYVTRIFNYTANDVERKGASGVPKEGAIPYTEAWLVTIFHIEEKKTGWHY